MSGIFDATTPGQALAIVLRMGADRIPAENPISEAQTLLAKAAGVEKAKLWLLDVEDFTEALVTAYMDLVAQRSARVPMSHILGYRGFWKHGFRVTPDVLDPRPETELLVELALAAPFRRVLDMGTGSGCILISLLAERPEARGVGTDTSPEAVLIAGENAARIGVADRITLPLSDWWEDLGGRYDLIVSNPPYIALDEMAGLAPELSYEPRAALTDEADGLTAYRAIAAGLADHLVPGGRVLLEIGPSQGGAVMDLLAGAGLSDLACLPDLDGRDRVVGAVFRKDS